MSGLYNMLMGRNPYGPDLLFCLGIDQQTTENYPLGRIRDVSTNDAGDRIFILTRNYGEEWEYVDKALAAHPNYVRKYPESDETYWSYEFTVPESNAQIVQEISKASDNTPPFERFTKAIADFGSGKENAMTDHFKKVGEKIMEPMLKAIQGNTREVVSELDGSVEIIGFESTERVSANASTFIQSVIKTSPKKFLASETRKTLMQIIRNSNVEIRCPHCRALLGVEESDVRTDDVGTLPAVHCTCAACNKIISLDSKKIPHGWLKN